ncbi:MAG: heavy-metal-associated domain-containing protein [Glaciimonas sp.]|nr:heavy-metal-associated domain-containing protein [Glaciimonas sp.]
MLKMTVADMNCGKCAVRITAAIKIVDDHAIVDVDVAKKQVTIQSDVKIKQLLDAIVNAGYTPVENP